VEVPILKQGEFLIATFQAALSDADLKNLRIGLVQQVVRFRSRAVIVDVTAMDVMDSFASRTLREIAQMIRLRGAETIIVGIQPEVAFAMVQLGLTLEGVATALDLEEGLAYLNEKFKTTNWRWATVSAEEVEVAISSDQHVVLARQKGRAMAIELGFSSGDATLIATAISELARNIVSYAGKGKITLRAIHVSSRVGIQVVASDEGPGIPDVRQALRDGFSTSGSLGLGLPGVRRLVDEFGMTSYPGQGTTVTVRKWKL
jgi:anti-sigma regulatory factor (Ser/Thr protein kinase)/anti-anti-sigma regulatory factor